MTDPLLDELLSKPVGSAMPPRQTQPERDFTSEIEISRDSITATLKGEVGAINEGTALHYLQEEGQNPDDWEVTHFRKLKWGDTDSPRESVKFSFRRKTALAEEGQRPPLDELFGLVKKVKPKAVRAQGDYGFPIVVGDMQFGKIDGDGVEGTLRRTIGCIDEAANNLMQQRKRFDIGHVHIGWMGDHIEGFNSQGGANVWRTPLTLNEQIRLTRRVMMHALLTFAPLAETLSMVAVPGNHGEAVRLNGKGLTRYDDSHDTESLIAVSDAAKLNPEAFGHVKFYVPETDELTVVTEVAGTIIAHAHGHQWRPAKHFEWWRGQAFNKASAMHQADVLLAGHLHHEFVDTDGYRTFIQPPAMESESTWWRHAKGTGGAPGLITAVTKDGLVPVKEVVRA